MEPSKITYLTKDFVPVKQDDPNVAMIKMRFQNGQVVFGKPKGIKQNQKLFHFGGQGSGNFGHSGRPGLVGGSDDDGSIGTSTGDSGYKKIRPNGVDTMEQYTDENGNWTEERKVLHEKIISHFFEGKTPVEDPTSYILGGGPAAGKTTILQSGHVNVPENSVLAAGDDIKLMLPEYELELAKGNVSSAMFVHEESSYLSKQIAKRAAAKKYNLIMDGTGDSGLTSLKAKVDSMRSSGQPVVGIYATIDIDTAVKRSIIRAQQTKRYMPEAVLRSNHQAISRIFPDIVKSGMMDQVQLFDTSFSPPKMIAIGAKGTLTIHDKDAYQRFLDKAK